MAPLAADGSTEEYMAGCDRGDGKETSGSPDGSSAGPSVASGVGRDGRSGSDDGCCGGSRRGLVAAAPPAAAGVVGAAALHEAAPLAAADALAPLAASSCVNPESCTQ